MKNGYARIKILPNTVQLRFEQIDFSGRSNAFDLLRDKLYHEIPEARWDKQIRWMVLPANRLNKALDFCYQELGVGRVRIERGYLAKDPTQLPLRLNLG